MYNSRSHGIVFLLTDRRLNNAVRNYITREAIRMYYAEEEEKDLQSEGLEGKIYATGKYQMLGQFGGRRFNAEIETQTGKAVLHFLITKYASPEFN
jgi:hypothetical protein